MLAGMSIDATTSAVPPQVLAALAAIANTQAAELAVSTALEQGVANSAAPLDPNLGQVVNISA